MRALLCVDCRTLLWLGRPDTGPEVLVRMGVIRVLRECAAMTGPRTLVDKIWDDHVVAERPGAPSVLAVDLHLVHEVTSPQAFTGLRRRGLRVRHPERTVATADHSVPTTPRNLPILDELAAAQVAQLEANCREFGIPL